MIEILVMLLGVLGAIFCLCLVLKVVKHVNCRNSLQKIEQRRKREYYDHCYYSFDKNGEMMIIRSRHKRTPEKIERLEEMKDFNIPEFLRKNDCATRLK